MSTDERDNDDTVVPLRRTTAPALGPDLEDTRVPGATRVVEIVEGDTLALPRRADRAASEATAPASLDDTAPRSASPAADRPMSRTVPTPPRAAVPPLRLRLPNGTIAPVDRMTVLGRNPRATRIPMDPPPAFVTLPSPGREISASHAVIEQVGEDAIVVTDLHSANGTTLLLPSGSSRQLVAGDSAVVPVGTVLIFGEGNAVTVLGPVAREPVTPEPVGAPDNGGAS